MMQIKKAYSISAFILLFTVFLCFIPVSSYAQTNSILNETQDQKEARLRAELAQVEAEQRETERVLVEAQNQSSSLKRDILILDTKIKAAELNIKAKNILIENCEIYYNYFDGIAGYDSTECEIRNCRIHSNRAAALSFDWSFNDVLVRDCVFHHNETAVFIRDCKNISFGRIKMLDNKRFGWYVIQRDDLVETTPENITFFEIEDDSPDTLINIKKNNKQEKDGY